MAVIMFAPTVYTVTLHGVDTVYWYRSGLYCRTQISVQSFDRIIGHSDQDGASRSNFRFAPSFYIHLEVFEMETKEYLTTYYERYDENGRLVSKHGMIEYITTMKYIEKYLQPGMRILETGA